MKAITIATILAPLLALASPIEILHDLAERQSSCAPLELYHWAGTTESGRGIVGDALARDVPAAIPGSTVTGVQYNTAAEYVFTVQAAGRAGSQLITQRAAACPSTSFVLSGYSKGALVVDAIKLSTDVQARVKAITVFGDPATQRGGQTYPINNKGCIFSYCNKGDIFCSSVPVSLIPHLAYATDGSTQRAAQGIKSCA